MELSLIVSGIRPTKWIRFYDCVKESFSGEFEVIFIGPFDSLPTNLKDKKNVKFISDKGSPVRCSQRAACEARGKYVSICADDMFFFPGTIDRIFELLHANAREKKFIVTGKYYEGHKKKHKRDHSAHQYYLVNNSTVTRSPFIQSDWLILNLFFMRHDYFMDIGGLDTIFEGTAMSVTDLANRVQHDGAIVVLPEYIVADVEFTPGTSGDHGPVVAAQIEHDEPLYQKMYRSPDWIKRIVIDPQNWKLQPEIWKRRFK